MGFRVIIPNFWSLTTWHCIIIRFPNFYVKSCVEPWNLSLIRPCVGTFQKMEGNSLNNKVTYTSSVHTSASLIAANHWRRVLVLTKKIGSRWQFNCHTRARSQWQITRTDGHSPWCFRQSISRCCPWIPGSRRSPRPCASPPRWARGRAASWARGGGRLKD